MPPEHVESFGDSSALGRPGQPAEVAPAEQGSHGGIDLPASGITRVKNHLAKYYKKMVDTDAWARD